MFKSLNQNAKKKLAGKAKVFLDEVYGDHSRFEEANRAAQMTAPSSKGRR